MATVSPTWLYPDRGLRSFIYANGSANNLFMKIPFAGKTRHSLTGPYRNKSSSNTRIRCEKSKKKESSHEEVSIERAPYYSYMDSTSGQYEPASGARASIPSQEYWPEGTASQVKAARAPEPGGVSTGAPSFGKKPGSRRGKNRASVASSLSSEESMALVDDVEVENSDDGSDGSREFLENEYVVYENGKEREEMSEYEMDKREGRPHPFIDPEKKKPIKETLSSEELWWNWRKPEKEQWSRWQRRRPDVETVFLKAMAETGQVKIYGETPTLTETALYRARRKIYKEERLQAEQERLQEIGPLAYYSEWVKAWKRDTSREAIQKHFEETGEDENTQLMEMFSYQTDKEYRIMMGTDVRIKRDPLAMRMREDQIKQIWGGDPVYPTVNYIQDPDEVIDFRGADFHEPTPNMLDYLKEHRKVITREEVENILSKEKTEQIEVSDIDEAMARAVDIGETDDEEAESETEDSNEEEKITRDWSNVKSMPHLQTKKEKPKKDKLSLDEAVDDSENLTDFLLDFDEEE